MKLPTRTCKRCGASWIPRKAEKPQLCPRCRNRLWDTDRKYKKPKRRVKV